MSRKRTTRKPPKALRAYLVELGRRGGKARAKNLTAEERRVSASQAAKARWAKRKQSG